MELILIRHSEILNPDKLCYGQTEMPLTSTFEDEAKLILGKCVAFNSHKIYASPALRCTILAEKFDRSFDIEPRLYEMAFGEWEGIAWDKIAQEPLLAWMDNFVVNKVPLGESYLELQSRVLEFIAELNQFSGRKYLLICHAGPIRALISTLLNISLYDSFNLTVSYGDIFKLEIIEGLQPILTYL